MNNFLNGWEPKTLEDKLLVKYWGYYNMPGELYLEVPIGLKNGKGNWPEGTKVRRIDGIRVFQSDVGIYSSSKYSYSGFSKRVKGQHIELIEAKKKLNRLVIGQVIAGIDMFKREYDADTIKGIIVCAEGDPALEWVCNERDIDVVIFKNK